MSTAPNAIIGAIIDIRPLQPTIGAEIHGIDISRPLSAEERRNPRRSVAI